MAIKVAMVGTSDMRQFERAIATIKKAQWETMKASGGFQGSMARISDATSKAGRSMSAAGSALTKGLTLPLAAAGAGLYKATQMAADDAQAQVKLAATLRNTAGATQQQIAATEAWITAQGKALGITDDELRPAIASLATATGDLSKAQMLAGTAMDLATAKGIPLETAANALAKAYAGNTTSLGRMLPGIDQAALKSKNFGKIYDEVNRIVGGQAATAANTEAGARQRANVALQESIESLGASFLPIMQDVTTIVTTQVVPAIQKVTSWFSSLDKSTQGNIVKFGLLLAAVGPALSIFGSIATGISAVTKAMALMKVATIQATAAKWAENAAWLASPITWIVAGIMAVVAAIVLLWKNNEGFRKFVIGAWDAIKNAFAAAFNWVKKNWPLILAILTGPIGLAVRFIVQNWDKIVATAKQVPGKILNAFRTLGQKFLSIGRDIINGIWQGLQNGWEWLKGKISGLAGSLLDAAKGALGINSPSKKFYEVGVNIDRGLANGIKAGKEGVLRQARSLGKDTVNAAVKYANQAMENGYGKLDPMLFPMDFMTGDTSYLIPAKSTLPKTTKAEKAFDWEGLLKTEETVKAVDKVAEAMKKLKDATAGFMANFQIGEVVKQATMTAQGMLDAVASQAAAMQNFVANIATLRRAGLAKGVVNQLLAGGAAQSGAQAAALAQMTPEQIAAYNASYKQQWRYSRLAARMQQNATFAPNVTINVPASQSSAEQIAAAVEAALASLARELRAA